MKAKYVIAGLVSFSIWGFVPIIFRKLQGYEQYEIMTFRMLFAAIIMLIVLLFNPKEHINEIKQLQRKPTAFKNRTYFLTAIGAILFASNWICYIYLINNISVNAGAFAYTILPIVTAFIAHFTIKERLSKLKWLGIFFGCVSCAIIGNVNPEQMIYVSVVTLSYSIYLVSQRVNLFFNRRLLIALQFTIGSIIMVIANDYSFNKPLEYWFYLFILAAFFTVTPFLLNLYALKNIESSQLAFMIYVNPIITFVLGVTLYNEVIDYSEMLAYTILLAAIGFFNWSLFKSAFINKSKKSLT